VEELLQENPATINNTCEEEEEEEEEGEEEEGGEEEKKLTVEKISADYITFLCSG
jgi:hypothetical protein